MCFFIGLMPATLLMIVSYFVLFSSNKTDSRGTRIFGQVLAIWLFVIAASIFITASYVTLAGLCPFVPNA
jgi:hypothetical protein